MNAVPGNALSDRLIVALDVPDILTAAGIVERLGDSVSFYKIGYQLVYSGGLPLVRDLAAAGKKVFLDLKLLDIDNTMEKGVEAVTRLGATMLTVHAYPKAMQAAVKAAQGSGLILLGVTVLTSMDARDLSEAGYHDAPEALVAKRARQALNAGMGGVVCSAAEAELVRDVVGPQMAVVTPGIRPAGGESGDQKRVVTPGAAICAGASHLVVGRPIAAAADPRAAALDILDEMRAAAGRA